MQVILGILIMIGAPIIAVLAIKHISGQSMAMQATDTSKLSDVITLIDDMCDVQSDYRHYAEIKGYLHTKEDVIAPLSENKVVYYQTSVKSVHEETYQDRDSDGNTRTKVKKHEDAISSENSTISIYVKDDSTDQLVEINIDSFLNNGIELKKSVNKLTEPGHQDYDRTNTRYSSRNVRTRNASNMRFVGYLLSEKVLTGSPIYILGDMYKTNGEYFMGRNTTGKTSKLTHKTEDEMVDGNTKNLLYCKIGGAVGGVVGLFIIIANFF